MRPFDEDKQHEFTDEEVDRYRSAVWYGGRMTRVPRSPQAAWAQAEARGEMRRLMELGWTPPPPPRYYAKPSNDGWDDWLVMDREDTASHVARFAEEHAERYAREHADRLNREHT